jgi:hypothetical protein
VLGAARGHPGLHDPRTKKLFQGRSPDRHGRGVDYSIALVERLSAFFIIILHPPSDVT